MSSHHKQPEKHGSGAAAHAPQVAVRDGNRLLCPCCGEALMVLADAGAARKGHQASDSRSTGPKKTSGRKPVAAYPLDSDGLPRPQSATLNEIIRRQEAAREAAAANHPPAEPAWDTFDPESPGYRADGLVCRIDPKVEAYQVPAEDPPPLPEMPKLSAPRLPSREVRPPRVRDEETRRRERERYRLKRPLRQPSTYEGKRLLAWYFYRMKALDLQLQQEVRQQEQAVEQLRYELYGPAEAKTSPREKQPLVHLQGQVNEMINCRRRQRVGQAIERRHAHADGSMAPETNEANERGPP